MKWYAGLIDGLESGKTYSRKDLANKLRMLRDGLSDSAYYWAIDTLIGCGSLTRAGYNTYSLPSDRKKIKYEPYYSDLANEIIRLLSDRFPKVRFTVFETVLMNEFLNHLIAQNTVFVQVEKDVSAFIFRFLQEQEKWNILYKPDLRAFNLYWSRDCVIVTDLISEAPMRSDNPHSITLEKMLVDMLTDKIISHTYSKAEYPSVLEEARDRYNPDNVKMLRYARRRNREKCLLEYLNEPASVRKIIYKADS